MNETLHKTEKIEENLVHCIYASTATKELSSTELEELRFQPVDATSIL